MVQDEQTGVFRSVAPVHWPVGFGDRLPDDGSRLEPSKCAVRFLNKQRSIQSGVELVFEILLADNFGNAPVGTQHLILAVVNALSGVVLSRQDIFSAPNGTVWHINRLAPSDVGLYNVSLQDAVSQQHLSGSPVLLEVEGADVCLICCHFLTSNRLFSLQGLNAKPVSGGMRASWRVWRVTPAFSRKAVRCSHARHACQARIYKLLSLS